VSGRHVLRPNMDDSPESEDGLEVQVGERVRFLKEIAQIGEHVGGDATPLEGAAYGWPGNLSMKVRGTIICIYIIYHFIFKFVCTYKVRF
jgi:hypothetical protein